jgi:hypothetical protein
MELRVSRLEDDMRDVKSAIGRLETDVGEIRQSVTRMETMFAATLPHLATKADLADLRAEFADLRTELRSELADKPGKVYMWGILGVLLTAYACGLAALAILK